MSEFLQVLNLSKSYPGESLGAVNQVSFSLSQGEILSFVGESGSGKSTLLRMLAGLMKPDEGEILFSGEPLENPEEQLIAGHQQIKMVFQDFDLMPNMSVAENIRYPLLSYDKAYAQERVSALLTLCGLSSLADRLPRELSGGQQQRVALARALADEPELLLMDEPFSQLDPVNKSGLLQDLLRIIRTEEVALVLVTHDTNDALMISDRVGFLRNGRLMQLDSPERIYHQPTDREVAAFFGHVNWIQESLVTANWPDLGELMKDKGTNLMGIRAEHLVYSQEEKDYVMEVEVKQSWFQGSRNLVQADWSGTEVFFYYPVDQQLPPKTVKLSFLRQFLLFFCC